MDKKISSRDGRNNKSIATQNDDNVKAKLELQKKLAKLAKLDKLIEEANKQSDKQHQIYDDVKRESQKTFTDLPMTNPTAMDMQNPDYAHNLTYKQINPLKKAFIPKGKDGQEVRDEINLFLKEGKRRGRDSRQAYIHIMVEAVNTFKHWVNEFGGKQIPELYNRFYDINKKLGFRK